MSQSNAELKADAVAMGIDVDALNDNAAKAKSRVSSAVKEAIEPASAMTHKWGSQNPGRNASLLATVSTIGGLYAALQIAPAVVLIGSTIYSATVLQGAVKDKAEAWFKSDRQEAKDEPES